MKDFASRKPGEGHTAFRASRFMAFRGFFKTLRAKERLYSFQRQFLSKFDQIRPWKKK